MHLIIHHNITMLENGVHQIITGQKNGHKFIKLQYPKSLVHVIDLLHNN